MLWMKIHLHIYKRGVITVLFLVMCYQKCVTRENEPSKRKIEVLENQDITQVKT